MVGLDTQVRMIHRLSIFQWIILNALTIELQPVDGSILVELGITDKAQLATEIAAQILRHSIVLSNRILENRKTNACAGLKKVFEASFVSKIQEPQKGDDPSKLFGGKVKKLVKSRAKEIRDVASLSKVAKPQPRSSRPTSRG